ncbi:hypothetical protein Amet_3512 [Alkaliphilus metalliredigens QYMF]|uniref:DUF1468 domain-containing protein n=1 Tax=Alkaliphilus metalliredigens (strain QYMF) TaxID=293826 RepID=A6TTX1_ALKMQ|nr:tripartite tricarboxylate transporter TctB family protein [Alkaliphilus metalliredigens]ABR49639.1 hypothetical protein Amet_3512 [Alkaliphilus metalliredigens QYMF]
MTDKRVTFNGIIGILLTAVSSAGFFWTYFSPLRSMELFVPRISLALIAIGGLMVFIKDFMNPEKAESLSKKRIIPYAIGVSVAMWLYNWAFRNIGLVTGTFLFLSIWWIWVAFQEAKRKGTFESFKPKVAKMLVLAMTVSVVVHLLFISLLRMHMPRTFFP